jgi:hypothetical protein
MPAKKKAKGTTEKKLRKVALKPVKNLTKLNVSVVAHEPWVEAPRGWVTNPGFKVGGGVE